MEAAAAEEDDQEDDAAASLEAEEDTGEPETTSAAESARMLLLIKVFIGICTKKKVRRSILPVCWRKVAIFYIILLSLLCVAQF